MPDDAGTPPLKVALAGAGLISWYHLEAWRKLGSRARVMAVCDPDQARAARRAREFSIPSVYASADDLFANEDIEAIDIASPRQTHAAWIEDAARRGLGILCQKPLTPTLSEAETLIGRLDPATRLMVHENWRFRPWYRKARDWITAGELGQIHYAQMSAIDSGLLPDGDGKRPHLERQPFLAREARLMITEALIHHLDVMRYLCGPLRVVNARVLRTLAEVEGDSLATILLETPAGAPVLVNGSMAAPGFPASSEDRLEIIGGRASIVLSDTHLRLLGPTPQEQRYDAAAGYQRSFDDAIGHFVTCLEQDAPFETGVADNLETLRLVEDAYGAARVHGAAQSGISLQSALERC